MIPLKVLCVEHDSPSRATLQRTLEQSGYEVVCAGTGEQAMTLFAGQSVDGVLLEYDLPDKNGATVRAEMKRLKPEVPVLLFSGVGPQTPMLLHFFGIYLRDTRPIQSGLREV
jgi:two-component system OmpR family response regulator